MNNEYPSSSDEKTERMQQEVARQQIAAEQAQENARFLASENSTLRTRVAEGSNGMLHLIGFLMVLAALVASVVFLTSSTQDTRQEAAATRQEASAANHRANSALDAAYRSGQRSQAASATAQQAANTAARAEQNSQKPTVILNPPPPAPIIVTPAEPAPPMPATPIPDNSEPKPLDGKIE